MPNRSRTHMLRVLAMRMDGTSTPDKLVDVVRKVAQELEAREADGRTHNPEDEKRIERQRTLFATLPDTGAVDALKEAMMQRAYDLMWDGDGLACDAIAEFLPPAAADEVFNAWDNDQDPSKPRSRFH